LDECKQIEQDDNYSLNNKLIYCKEESKIYKLKANTKKDAKFYDIEPYLKGKEEVESIGTLEINSNGTGEILLTDIFKKIKYSDINLNPSQHTLNLDNKIDLNVNVTNKGPKYTNIELDSDFNDLVANPKDYDVDYFSKVTVKNISVKNWLDYQNKPSNPNNGEKYYLKANNDYENGVTVENGWTVGKTYQYDFR
jgi:hypothetical protein